MEYEKEKNFIAYDYKEVITDSSKASFILDGYESFGWELDQKFIPVTQSPNSHKTVLRLKRNRKIINKMELTRLQRHFVACVKEIDELEKSKGSKATVYALSAGIIGTAFMAGSVFAVTAQPPHIILCIFLAIPAFIGWIVPYFAYRKVVHEETARIEPLIEAKYDEIYELLEKGNKLLH